MSNGALAASPTAAAIMAQMRKRGGELADARTSQTVAQLKALLVNADYSEAELAAGVEIAMLALLNTGKLLGYADSAQDVETLFNEVLGKALVK